MAELVDVAAAMATHADEERSGDLHVVVPHAGGTLVAVIDGLGHGDEAAHAARTAAEALTEAADRRLAELFELCHARLRRSRGVVMSVASFEPGGTMSWIGVGNVEAVLVRGAAPSESILLLGGVLGHNLPSLRISTTGVAAGDTVVFATDGVGTGFLSELDSAEEPQQLADRILAEHGKETDDALVVVARYRG